MFAWLRKNDRGPARRHTFRPGLERLERRDVPTVTWHGGPVINSVQAQALYLGADWTAPPPSANLQVTAMLDTSLQQLVTGSYMDMLTNAGYAINRGSASPGQVAPVILDKSQYLTDSQIQGYIQGNISNGLLQAPGASSLYVVYVEANVVVQKGSGTSVTQFEGYHRAFPGYDAAGNPVDIRYAVIPYPGGLVGNLSHSYFGTFDDLTNTTSHEVAEAVTDPDVNYGGTAVGWYDDQLGEVGDVAQGRSAFLYGHAVQRIANQKDQPMTPTGAASAYWVTFVLKANGNLVEFVGGGTTPVFLLSNVAAISDQGIDDHGQAMVDAVSTAATGSVALEYRQETGWTQLTQQPVLSAKASQGVSYVLFKNGQVGEYVDKTQTLTRYAGTFVAIDAGTDSQGVNVVDALDGNGTAWEGSDSNGYWESITDHVRSVSAGQQGYLAVVKTNGNAYLWFHDQVKDTWTPTWLASGVTTATAGTSPSGSCVVALLYGNGQAWEYRVTSPGWLYYLDKGVTSLSKRRNGIIDLVYSDGSAWELNWGWFSYLGANVSGVG